MTTNHTRRNVLKGLGGLAGLSLLGAGSLRTALAQQIASDDVWKQASGTTLQFISENTPPTSAIATELAAFEELTGIEVNITSMELSALVQKVALDFGSGSSSFDLVYADPYQVLAPYHRGLVDLNTFINDDSLPGVPNGTEDFIAAQLTAAGRFGDGEQLYTLPYDCPTMIWIYRRDLFEKYRERMQQDLGFDPMPSADSTWEQYFQIAQWFNANDITEVGYGTGHQAKQHDSLMCDFSNVLFSYGGEYFANGKEVGLLGTTSPGPCQFDSEASLEAAHFYKKLLDIAHPGSTSWDWTGVANAFQNGEFAMMPQWHEFAASLEASEIGGKIGYAPLPKGPSRSSNLWGGTGIGINANAAPEVQKAAWLFLVWATAPQTQLSGLKSTAGGGTPTRHSVYEMPEVKAASTPPTDMPNMLTAETMLNAWQVDNIGLRPKIAQWNEVDTVIFTQLSRMLAGQLTPDETMRSAKERIDRIVGV